MYMKYLQVSVLIYSIYIYMFVFFTYLCYIFDIDHKSLAALHSKHARTAPKNPGGIASPNLVLIMAHTHNVSTVRQPMSCVKLGYPILKWTSIYTYGSGIVVSYHFLSSHIHVHWYVPIQPPQLVCFCGSRLKDQGWYPHSAVANVTSKSQQLPLQHKSFRQKKTLSNLMLT